ncbi:MAG: hypothetical protein K9K75_02375 [Deltaproteobacteria bacterium]|nr:hypothetical protein [Deltaproteobacteria bacterium]
MAITDKRYCAICAWRQGCQKRFTVSTGPDGTVICPDYTRDVAIKDEQIETAKKKFDS